MTTSLVYQLTQRDVMANSNQRNNWTPKYDPSLKELNILGTLKVVNDRSLFLLLVHKV